MQNPDPEKIAKLPKWAQKYISNLELYLGQTRKEMDLLRGDQKEREEWHSHRFYTTDNVSDGRKQGPRSVDRYFVASTMELELDNGLHLSISPTMCHHDQEEIRLYYDIRRKEGINFDVALFPQASNALSLRKIVKDHGSR